MFIEKSRFYQLNCSTTGHDKTSDNKVMLRTFFQPRTKKRDVNSAWI